MDKSELLSFVILESHGKFIRQKTAEDLYAKDSAGLMARS